jgi:hypothetical protein
MLTPTTEDRKLSWSVLITGALFTIFGVGVYYLMPLSLLTFNLSLLLNMFVFLLIGMLLGLTLLSMNLQSTLEKALLLILFFWERVAIRY